MTFRHGGHHVNDPGLYLPADQLAQWKARDPLVLLRDRLARAGVGEAEIAAIDERVEALLEEAVEFATNSDNPSLDDFRAEIAAGELAFVG
jgi:pyruvate dehydrogenase E1 component alpha subunit